jgi:protein-L-isoaspartate(D-aspartate) O-methyltransferase
MGDPGQWHEALVTRLRASGTVSDRVADAFAAVPRQLFLPDVPPEVVYSDDAIVTHEDDGVPTSSSSQPSLMARMLDQLDVRPGDRVLEVGAGTGYNAALIAALGGRVTTVDFQDPVATAAREHLAAAGIGADVVEVVCGDGAAPPGGPYDRIIVTAGCWSLPRALAAALADGGRLVAPLRINAVELAVVLQRDGERLTGGDGIPCGFMPLRGGDDRPWRWELGGGGMATADADIGDEGRGALDRLLATPARAVGDPFELGEGEQSLGALLWIGLQGDPLISLLLPGDRGARSPWTIALHVLPGSLLVTELPAGASGIANVRLHGGEGALRACRSAMESWRAAGSPPPRELELTVAPNRDRAGWSLPFPDRDGAATMVRGSHRWTLRYR